MPLDSDVVRATVQHVTSVQSPVGLALAPTGEIVIVSLNHAIWTYSPSVKALTKLAGSGQWGFADGVGAAAMFNAPSKAVAAGGAIYVSDTDNHAIRKVSSTGAVTTLIGGPTKVGYLDGPLAIARLSRPTGLAVNAQGEIIVADSGNYRIRSISLPLGTVSTLAGSGVAGNQDGLALVATLTRPHGLVATNGDILISDLDAHCIRKLSGAQLTTAAGKCGTPGSADGPASTAAFQMPAGLSTGYASPQQVLIADANNNRIRVLEGGMVRTLAGSGTPGMVDGPALSAEFQWPFDVVAHGSGLVYVADDINSALRVIVL